MSTNVQSGSVTTSDQLVSDADYLQLRTERGWRLRSRRWIELYKRGDTIDIP